MRRFVYLGIALGLTMVATGLATVPGCYNVPRPPCGFRCGPGGACPADYTCSSFEQRCHLNGSDPSLRCDGTDDGADAMIDSPIDAAVDSPGADAGSDALDAGSDALDASLDALDGSLDALDAPTD